MNTQPVISKRALTQAFAFKFPDSPGPDYNVLTMFTGPQARSFSLQDLEVYEQKTIGDASTLKYGFYVTMVANGEAEVENMRAFGAVSNTLESRYSPNRLHNSLASSVVQSSRTSPEPSAGTSSGSVTHLPSTS
jgi:hypothetical protein